MSWPIKTQWTPEIFYIWANIFYIWANKWVKEPNKIKAKNLNKIRFLSVPISMSNSELKIASKLKIGCGIHQRASAIFQTVIFNFKSYLQLSVLWWILGPFPKHLCSPLSVLFLLVVMVVWMVVLALKMNKIWSKNCNICTDIATFIISVWNQKWKQKFE